MLVKLAQCHPNDWNPNRMDGLTYAKTIESIKTFGFIDPITIRPHPDHPGWQIIDGENRWKAARDLGLDEGPAYNLGDIGRQQQQASLANQLQQAGFNYQGQQLGLQQQGLGLQQQMDANTFAYQQAQINQAAQQANQQYEIGRAHV